MPVKTKPPLDVEFVRSILDYDPVTGIFRWRYRSSAPKNWNTRYAGAIAGTKTPDGYICIQIGKTATKSGIHYRGHILAWLLVYGEWAPNGVDHRHGTRDDNRIAELRKADSSENACNKAMQRNNKSGFVGVHFDAQRGKWRARVSVNRTSYDGGFFDTAEEAAAARPVLVTKIQGAFAPEDANRPRYRHSREYIRKHH